jgi:hypothetical protein
VQLTGVPVATPFAVGSMPLPVSVPTAITPFQSFVFSPANEMSVPSSDAILFRDTMSNPAGESDAPRTAWETWLRLEMQPTDAKPIGNQAAPPVSGTSVEHDNDAFWFPASPQRDLLPPDDLLPASAVSSVFAEWETNAASILLAPKAGTAQREAATDNASSLAWAGLLAMMVGGGVPVRTADRRSQQVALKR